MYSPLERKRANKMNDKEYRLLALDVATKIALSDLSTYTSSQARLMKDETYKETIEKYMRAAWALMDEAGIEVDEQ